MIDFSKLGVGTPEERAADDRARRDREYARDDAARDAASRKAVVITLDREPEMRTKPDGTEIAVFRGREDGRASSLVAIYEKPLRAVNEDDAASDFDRKMRALGGGDRMTLAGSWAKRFWNDQAGQRQEAWEFKSQHFAKGEVPLERMLSTAREVPSPGMAAARQAARGAGI